MIIKCIHIFVGALLKAAFFCAEVLPLKRQPESLADFLKQTYGSGFVLQTWSNLPQGSGLGTSSILAGAVISSLWTVVGFKHDTDMVIHAVSSNFLSFDIFTFSLFLFLFRLVLVLVSFSFGFNSSY